MAQPQTSPNPTSADLDSPTVDFAGLVDALDLDADQRAHFNLPNDGDDEPAATDAGDDSQADDAATVALEGDEPVTSDAAEPQDDVTDAVDPKDLTDGKLPESVQRRIDKLTAEKYNLSEELAQVKSQLQQKATPTPAATPDQPLAHVQNSQDLNTVHEQALQAKEWALMNMDGGVYLTQEKDGTQKEVNLDATQVREVLVKASRLLDRDIPKRRQYLQEAAGHFAEARQAYPQLFNPKTKEAQMASNLVARAPWITSFPDWPLIVGHTIRGLSQYLAEKQGNQQKQQAAVKTKAEAVTNPKIIGSPRGQAGPRTRPARNPAEYGKAKNNTINVGEAADLLDIFVTNKF